MEPLSIKNYDGQALHKVLVTRKIDGICAHREGGSFVSKAGKPLYNIPKEGLWDIAEIFLGSWENSMSACRTQGFMPIRPDQVYPLFPEVDPRLVWCYMPVLDQPIVQSLLDIVVGQGYEGLVLYSEEGIYKAKPVITFDVKILAVYEGTGKWKGMMGGLVTPMGNVSVPMRGLGLGDDWRKHMWSIRNQLIGKIVEVGCDSLTPQGKFTMPRFIRIREDK